MSEVRTTEPVEAIQAPQPEQLVSLAALLAAGVGLLTYQTGKLAVKGVVAGSVLAYKGACAVGKAIQKPRALSPSEVDEVVAKSQTAGQALAALSATSGFDLPAAQAEEWKARIQKLTLLDDKLGVTTMAREIVRARQDRLQVALLRIAGESLQEIGFTSAPLRVEHGVIVGKGQGRQTITMSVDKTKEGGVRLHFDADGFHGDACNQALDTLQKKMQEKGVSFRVSTRRRKDEQPVLDGRRQPKTLHNTKNR